MFKKITTHLLNDSLYRNSMMLMLSTTVTAGFGFIFWILNARIFTSSQIGLATAIVSSTGLITEFSLLGLKNGVLRYLHHSKESDKIINTAGTIIAISTLLLITLFIFFIPRISPQLMLLREHIGITMVMFLFVLSFSLNQLQEGIFIAYRSTSYIVLKSVIWGILKVTLPFLFIGYGAIGIFAAFSIGSVVSFVIGLFILIYKFNFVLSPTIHRDILKQIGTYSFGDYLGSFFAQVPYFLAPLMILNQIGSSESAFYYIALQIANLLYIIPGATTQSLFAEGSTDEEKLKDHVKKAFVMIAILMIPAIIATCFFGTYVLAIFGKTYATSGTGFLQILGLSGVFISINNIGSAVVHIRKKIYLYVMCNAIAAISTSVLLYFLLPLKLIGVGYAFISGQGIISLIYILLIQREYRR